VEADLEDYLEWIMVQVVRSMQDLVDYLAVAVALLVWAPLEIHLLQVVEVVH